MVPAGSDGLRGGRTHKVDGMNGTRRGATAMGQAGQALPAGRLPRYARPDLVFLLVFFAFVIARYISVNERMDLLRTLRFEFLVGLAATICAGMRLAKQPPAIGKARPLILWMAALFVIIAIQVPFAADSFAPTIFNDRVFKFALLAFLIAVFVDTPKILMAFLVTFLFSVFYITLEATQGLISGGLYWQSQGIMRLHGAVGQYGHPNSLGGVALGTMPFVVFLLKPVRNWPLRLGLLAASVTSMICVIYSGSRTSYIGLLALVLWAWFHQKNKLRALVVILGTALVVLPAIPDQYIQRFQSIGGHEAEGGSKVARVQILKDALVVFQEHPLGVGVGSFPVVRYARFGRSQDTHNLYLEVATNLGVQGLIVFFGFAAALMMTFRQAAIDLQAQEAALRRAARGVRLPGPLRRKAAKHFGDLEFLVAVARAGAGFILVRLALGAFGMDMYEIYWWFGSGLAISLSGLVVATRKRTRFLVSFMETAPQG